MSKKTYIHRNVNMMLYSHHMSPLMCWHNNVQTKCSTAVLENMFFFFKKHVDFEKY